MIVPIHTDFLTSKVIKVEQALQLLRNHKARLLIIEDEKSTIGVCDPYHLLLQTQQLKDELIPQTDFKLIHYDQLEYESSDPKVSYLLIQNDNGELIGYIVTQTMISPGFTQEIHKLTTDLEAIIDSIYDEILVVDGKGNILRVSRRRKNNLWGVSLNEIIGKNILELEDQGWFKPTVTRKVLEEKKKISVIQENRLGRKILAVGNPIFNEKLEIERIVIASRDITEMTQLKHELMQTKQLTKKYREEIDLLRKQQRRNNRPLIYQSNLMNELIIEVKRVASVESTVAINGESGVGKELIAQAIHQLSPRKDQPFIKINCGSIPENLLESELFGYEKGAFTGALPQGKKGLFELAHHGTLFLDEIAELPMNLQVKLLRAIQEKEIVKVGGTRTIPIDVRIISATNKNLVEMVTKGTFREDLFYRLYVIPLYVPPLRERIDDIEPLTCHFLDFFNEKFSSKKQFSEDAMEIIKAFHWPGNVRQLQNVIERAIVLTSDQLITSNELVKILATPTRSLPPVQVNEIIPLQRAVDLMEKQLIQMALKKYKTLTKVAEVLHVSQPTISRRYQKLCQVVPENRR